MSRWVIIDEFPNYSVSESGEVLNDRTGRIMRGFPNASGQIQVGMVRDRVQYIRTVSKLVANAFLEPIKENFQRQWLFNTPINLDGDRSNNEVSNLCWRPLWFARKYHAQFRMGPHHSARVRELDTGLVYDNCLHAAVRYGVLNVELFVAAWGYTVNGDLEEAWPFAPAFELVDWYG